jgi:hypothetical protein
MERFSTFRLPEEYVFSLDKLNVGEVFKIPQKMMNVFTCEDLDENETPSDNSFLQLYKENQLQGLYFQPLPIEG